MVLGDSIIIESSIHRIVNYDEVLIDTALCKIDISE